METEKVLVDKSRYSEIRTLLALGGASFAPASAAQLLSVGEDFHRADDIWPAYQRLPFAANAGLSGLYGCWLARALADNVHMVAQLAPVKSRILEYLLAYTAEDESLNLQYLNDNRRALDQCFFHLQSWYEGLGGSGRKFLERTEQLCTAMQAGPEHWAPALEEFNKLGDRELDKAAILAERMQTSEQGRIRAGMAQQRVTAVYNEFVALKPVPESTLSFIEEVILPSLQFTIINGSEHDSDWNFWVRVLQLMVWAVNPEKSEEDRQAFFQKGPALLSKLETTKANRVCTDSVYQSHLADFSEQVIILLKGQAPETVTAAKKQVSTEIEALKQLQTSSQEHRFSRGDWIEFDDGEQSIRCQFLMQATGTDLLLFVNRNGHKVLQKSVEQMTVCFEAGIAREIPQVPVASAALTATNARMAQLQQQLQARAQAKQQERDEAERKQREAHAARKRDLAARKEAETKARIEAKLLAQKQREQEQAALERRQAEEREAHEQAMCDKLDHLTLGTWADLPLADGKTVRCKLAVSMRSTGKYIFVDRVGTKVAELKYDELLAYLVEGRAVFHQPEQGFENRLETIVRGLRRTE
ncbi:DUF1631 family protein [Gilvimarinus sp. SDUM040013]|uniref:DUF1631 family protein n=1 Tax=Gilvimarinus gilvus TaxID=3058038 RepID=A0ABU4RZA1_9GAMM|nr:DUF1631 family protein [Gilvimarinus sp. SDUM040013]MDO3387543.1 DUF1631 family protein [Gilvimarinus sp. SDUM040013]MDX6850192.1 DUF1631 family protein [Gilvimarinus sp. SDUM040013]